MKEKSQCKPATKEELKWIAKFKNLAKECPPDLWLYSGSGTLCVMKLPEDGNIVGGSDGTGINQDNVIGTIDIRNDGGDW